MPIPRLLCAMLSRWYSGSLREQILTMMASPMRLLNSTTSKFEFTRVPVQNAYIEPARAPVLWPPRATVVLPEGMSARAVAERVPKPLWPHIVTMEEYRAVAKRSREASAADEEEHRQGPRQVVRNQAPSTVQRTSDYQGREVSGKGAVCCSGSAVVCVYVACAWMRRALGSGDRATHVGL